ncbi:hypothetical protein JXL21_05885 [Candidatus Bathyarchaeota archaeon]|nr:hypothetical protein [Candidatus Bathyarchaeota archaeon]
MGQSTTVATAFTAIMLIAGVSILITSTISSFGVLNKGIDSIVSQSEVTLNERIAFVSWSPVGAQTIGVNVTNSGETSIQLRDFDKMDCIVTFTASGAQSTEWIAYDQDGDTDSYWKVNRVFFAGAEGDKINSMKLTSPIHGAWDPQETIEIHIWLNKSSPSFEYVTISTPGAAKASTDFYMEYELGTAVVPAGDITVDISHSLGRTPSNVQVTPMVELTDSNFWVSNVNSTHIGITIGTTFGFDIPFYWRIE